MIYWLLIINLLSYTLMWVDKLKSIYKWWRISERTLWILALLGGAGGIWLGMQYPLYHKAGKRSFRIGIPSIVFVWCIIIMIYLTIK